MKWITSILILLVVSQVFSQIDTLSLLTSKEWRAPNSLHWNGKAGELYANDYPVVEAKVHEFLISKIDTLKADSLMQDTAFVLKISNRAFRTDKLKFYPDYTVSHLVFITCSVGERWYEAVVWELDRDILTLGCKELIDGTPDLGEIVEWFYYEIISIDENSVILSKIEQ